MNSLSWFIYGVHLVNSVNVTLIILFIILTMLCACKIFGWSEIHRREETKFYPYYEWVYTGKDRISISLRSLIVMWLFVVGIDVFVPSKQTMILIAASEVGEKLATNEKVGQFVDPSLDLLKTWIEKEKADLIKEMKPAEEKKEEKK